jgi:hypothetical protein
MKNWFSKKGMADRENFKNGLLKTEFSSLKRVRAPQRAIENIYKRIVRDSGACHHAHESASVSGHFMLKKQVLVAIMLTLILTVPLTFFLTKRFATTGTALRTYVIRFVYENKEAKTVNIIGDFNHWNRDGIEMKKIPDTDIWTIEIFLTEGLYKYVFLIDDEKWTIDPLSPIKVKDNFGEESSLLVLLDNPE